jgi:hypothetical protein
MRAFISRKYSPEMWYNKRAQQHRKSFRLVCRFHGWKTSLLLSGLLEGENDPCQTLHHHTAAFRETGNRLSEWLARLWFR